MDLRSSTRSSRSRSKTPFALESLEQDIIKENHIEHSVSRSTRKTTTTVRTGNGSNVMDSSNEEYNSRSRYVKPSSSARATRSTKLFQTSDYSSEEGENEVTSTRTISEDEKNRILHDARKSADNSSGITALGLYRRAKRYWDEYPKTDWTYSPFSKDRVEIAPGVVAMPNMSRRHISSYDKYTNTDASRSLYPQVKPKNLFFNTVQTSTSSSESTTTVVSFVKNISVTILMLFVGIVYYLWRSVSYCFECTHSVSFRLAKVMYRMTSRVMLLDTWLLKKRANAGKATSLTALCLVPLLLFAGFHLYLVSGISIAPSCHPNCGKITTDYLKSLTNDIYGVLKMP